jgi:hypothetical protein
MSKTFSHGREVAQEADTSAAAETTGTQRRGRGRWLAVGIVVVVAAGAVSSWRAGAYSRADSSGTSGL